MNRWGIFGCGNMAQALTPGLCENTQNFLYTPSTTRALSLKDMIGGEVVNNPIDFPIVDYVFLGFKPQQLDGFLNYYNSYDFSRTIIFSVLAGTTVETLKKSFKSEKIIRVMPNTPSLIGEGANLIYFSNSVSDEEKAYFLNAMEKCGKCFEVSNESEIDIITAVSGSGPAFIFEWERIMSNWLIKKGINDQLAATITAQMFKGASMLSLKDLDISFEQLRENVTSKKGVTFEALESFKTYQFEKITEDSLDKAYNRVIELSKGKS